MPTPLTNYRSYKNLPPLAGLCSMDDAIKPGMSLEECVTRLKRIHYAFRRLHDILSGKITSEPIYELKTAFAHHAYLCAEHATAIRQRVSEMREPPLGLDEIPHPALEVFFDEVRAAPTTEEFVTAMHLALTLVEDAITDYHWHTHPLTDAPSKRVLRFANLEVEEMQVYYDTTIDCLCPTEPHSEWEDYLIRTVKIAKGISGTAPEYEGSLERKYSAKPFAYDPIPQRDERFTDHWNQGVNAEAFLYDESQPAPAKVLMMLFKRLREIDVPEMMASILAQTPGKPWGYYRDMSRQVWDEARHAMMGEVGFVALGVDWTKAKITWNWSYRLNTECTPLERHGVLFFIEQGLMPRNGKRYEFEVAGESGIPLAATIQDFDWADEVLHSQIGRQWYVTQFENLNAALAFGDQAWSKILSNWTTVRDRGLTKHENWWPEIYRQACAAEGREPDPTVLHYSTTYEGKRADLKTVAE